MTRLEHATLSDGERRTLERFVALLEERLGEDLVSVWLYGSRARGEQPHEESDVDVLLVTRRGRDDWEVMIKALWEAADAEGVDPFWFAVQLWDPDWVANRRQIESFFIREVDRDKIVLAGAP